MQKMVCGTIILLLLLSGCAKFDKERKIFYGWGKYKDSDVEMESSSPIKDILGIRLLN